LRALEEKHDAKTLLLLFLIKNEGPVGRYRLDDMLDLPEGVVRGLLLKFLKNGYISASKFGCQLTVKGEKFLKKLLTEYLISEIKEFEMTGPLKIAEENVAVQIKGGAKLVKSAMDQRDIAVRVGARGAILLNYLNGMLVIPNVYSNLATKYPRLAKRLLNSFKLSEGDTIIICGAENKWRALEGSLAIALSMKKEI
jgi:predicted transcriptional regulator